MPDAWTVAASALVMLAAIVIRDGLSRNWQRMITRGGPLLVFTIMYLYFQAVPTDANSRAPLVRWALITLFTAWTVDTVLYLVDTYRHQLAAWLSARWRLWTKTKS